MIFGGAAMLAAVLTAVVGLVPASSAQVLPGPRAFVSNLDLECRRTNPYTPAFPPFLTRHLDPALTGLPAERVVLGPRQQLCVPVAKSGVIPPRGVIDFIRHVDLSCYQIKGLSVNFTLRLRQLNPVLAGLPGHTAVMGSPQQLCVPVIKNGSVPPPDVVALVRYIDLKCYAITPTFAPGTSLSLTHLNPVLSGVPPHRGILRNSRQLCVPVRKANQAVPAAILNIVRWIDLEKFDLATTTAISPVQLRLSHINPLLAGLPVERAVVSGPLQLAVPVAKNGVIPPSIR
ncbi:hypothetical protein [Actinomadura sp. DC4]|uniref:hypothetical protein n=1 Tax=Actinomadura sp. DC4 TaxID=3055069 RepID=UPI0025B0F35E|nr:hypothetical protein [Actinomadura sp. DC4]MDN3359973.1 hypothetical protein [Actinomadura sp. DC4]